jgi:hypothetical protein
MNDVAILPYGAAIMKDGRISIMFPTEQEALEYKKELEDSDSENWTNEKCGY